MCRFGGGLRPGCWSVLSTWLIRCRAFLSFTPRTLLAVGGLLVALGMGLPGTASAAAPQALILSSTVTTQSSAAACSAADTTTSTCETPEPSCSNASSEECALLDQGWNVTVVSPSTWDAMTRAQFASYQLLVLGDPTCGNASDLSAAVSNESTWEPVVDGSILVMGNDPVYHYANGGSHAGAGVLIWHGLQYAGAQSGKTGLYLDLNCYYVGAAPATDVPILDGIESGFSVTGAGCADNVHVVGTAGPLVGVTDSDLSGWSCSIQEYFSSWPSDFVPYTVDTSASGSPPSGDCPNPPSTFSAGVTGCPYMLARGGGVSPGAVSLSGPSVSAPIGTQQTLTASVELNGGAIDGATVTFTCTSGPCAAGSTQTATTDSNGSATLAYSSSAAGTDEWTASATVDGSTSTSSSAPVTWTQASTSTSSEVFDANTNDRWSGSETTGASAYDTATVSGVGGTTPTGTVTYSYYSNVTCSNTPVSAQTKTLSSGSVPNSAATGALNAGSYSYQASYSGDSNYQSSTGSCEPFTVGAAATSFTASANPTSTTYGNTVTLSATGLPSGASGRVTFTSGSSTLCAATLSSGSAFCATGTLSPATYPVTATYPGDSNYTGSAASTSFTINKASPSLGSVTAPSVGTAGSQIDKTSISATLSGGASPTGTVTFKVFGPQSSAPTDCSGGTPVGATPTSVSGNQSYSPSDGFTPPSAGDYWWYASYSGDANNNGANSGCAGSMTETIVASASPSLGSVTAPSVGTAGSQIDKTSISATLSGGASPTGTVTFKVFGPQSSAPTDCSGGTPVGATPTSVSGNQSYSPSDGFTPPSAGDYWWYASYSGDANNNGANSGCAGSMTETIVAADTSPPSISITRPGAGSAYTRGEVVEALYSCTDPDGPSDVASCSGPVPSGSAIPTQAVGAHSFTVTASDKAGNTSSLTHHYRVFATNGSGQMTAFPSTVSASSAHHTLAFSYKAARGGIWHGMVTLTVPAGWRPPSRDPTAPGYVTTSEGKVSITGRTITISIPILAFEHTLTITYGSRARGGPGATAPSAARTQTWPAQEKSLPTGTLTNLTNPPKLKVT
jgi:hypothetical protein